MESAQARCDLDTWHETWSTTVAAEAACAWHAYTKHPKVWQAAGNGRPGPRPGVLGNMLDPHGNEGYTCPDCGRTSFNPNDKREGYCGRCHAWTGDRKIAA